MRSCGPPGRRGGGRDCPGVRTVEGFLVDAAFFRSLQRQDYSYDGSPVDTNYKVEPGFNFEVDVRVAQDLEAGGAIVWVLLGWCIAVELGDEAV